MNFDRFSFSELNPLKLVTHTLYSSVTVNNVVRNVNAFNIILIV